MPNYNTPGVFVEEISKLPSSVAQVETAIPAFIGYTQKAEMNEPDDLKLTPKRITSLVGYEKYFGGAPFQEGLEITLTKTDQGNINAVANLNAEASPYTMYNHMRMFFANGGGPCYIVSAGSYSDPIALGDDTKDLQGALKKLEEVDEPTLLVMPDAINLVDAAAVKNAVDENAVSAATADYFSLCQAALAQCAKLGDRFVLLDVLNLNSDKATDEGNFRSNVGQNELKYGAAYYPNLKTSSNYLYNEGEISSAKVLENIELNIPNSNLADLKDANNEIYNLAKAALAKLKLTLNASPTVAGIYARVDSTRGVWKAPANVSLNGVVSPIVKITDLSQGNLNIDPNGGKSINAIRQFTGKGNLVWGARTLAGNDNEWRYISVRRLYIMVEESLRKSTSWVVFEPHDANTWVKVKSQIESYLTTLWRDGALAGAKANEAFYVNCGLGITMTPEDILEGKLNIEIGMAAVRPAEFIILKFSHLLQQG